MFFLTELEPLGMRVASFDRRLTAKCETNHWSRLGCGDETPDSEESSFEEMSLVIGAGSGIHMQTTTRLPQGVPSNYRELYNQQRTKLVAAAEELGITCHEVVALLQSRQVIEKFNPSQFLPDTFSREEACAYLGITPKEWNGLVKRMRRPLRGGTRTFPWAKFRPNPVNDVEFFSSEAVLWGPDIEALDAELDRVYPHRARPICARMSTAFNRRFTQILNGIVKTVMSPEEKKEEQPKVVQEPAPLKPSLDEWPDVLPKDNISLVKMYGPYVYDQLRRCTKIKTPEEMEEINQQVWMKLIEANFLEKFLAKATNDLPRTLTLSETLDYLGITEGQWKNAWAYHQRKKSYWMPAPIQGVALHLESLYLTADIITLDESGFLKSRRVRPRKGPKVTGRGFRSYLARAARNHWLNLCRTRRRRHKERPQEANLVLAPSSAGSYHKVNVREDAFSWEDSLVDSDVPMEDMMDFVRQLRRHNIDPRSDLGMFVFDALLKGSSIKDAVRLFGRAQSRQKATAA